MKRGEVLTPVEIPFDGQVLIVPEGSSYIDVISGSGYWEPQLSTWLLGELALEMTFVDAGAQIGYYTVLAAKRVAHVYAFEPRTAVRDFLRDNVWYNWYHNVTISGYALYSRQAEGYIGRDLDDGSGRQWAMFREGDPPEGFEVALTITLDAYLDGGRVDLAKIDVEGTEYQVLLGMEETVKQYAPTLAIELHAISEYYGWRGSDLARLFERWGYRWRGLAEFGAGRGLDWGIKNNRHIIAWKA